MQGIPDIQVNKKEWVKETVKVHENLLFYQGTSILLTDPGLKFKKGQRSNGQQFLSICKKDGYTIRISSYKTEEQKRWVKAILGASKKNEEEFQLFSQYPIINLEERNWYPLEFLGTINMYTTDRDCLKNETTQNEQNNSVFHWLIQFVR